MGMFDMVFADCPRCGRSVEFQSKGADAPYLERYTVEDAPAEVLEDVLNDPHYCPGCGKWFALVDPSFPPAPRIANAGAVAVRDPSEGEAEIYRDGSFGWWKAAFSYADIAQGTEAQRATTAQTGVVHDGPAGETDALEASGDACNGGEPK
jgi:hypothetical protein